MTCGLKHPLLGLDRPPGKGGRFLISLRQFYYEFHK